MSDLSSVLNTSYDVIVVGSGAAGLYASLCLSDRYQVALMTKDTLKTGASDWAQGGIAAAMNPQDSPLLHFQDTLNAGAGLCDAQAVKFLVENAPTAITDLVDLGVAFDRKDNHLAMTLEAAHSRPRVLHAADTTGKAIVSTLTEKVVQRPNIALYPQAIVLNLWQEKQCCQGVQVLYRGKIQWVRAKAVILATGGGGQVFAQTTNPKVSTGDGVALAWRIGAEVRDLEFVQFHPTALTLPNAPRFLISEAVRGEGAYLIDKTGHRFAFDYHPSGELAPRDVVSRAIFSHLQKISSDPSNDHVYLDLSPIAPEKISHRFPNIIRVCQRWGIDIFKDPIPVSPAAHYWMGGVKVDQMNQTSIKGLYAIGETASTGVHGANRLASNSLLECVVFASQLSQLSLNIETGETKIGTTTTEMELGLDAEEMKTLTEIRQQLPLLIWQMAGISRCQTGLETAIAQVSQWRNTIRNLSLSQGLLTYSPKETILGSSTQGEGETRVRLWVETLNLLDIAYLILKSALFRQESRGGHYRSDYPDTVSPWQVHTSVTGDRWQTTSID
ncbi:MAG: L-aspartate oxidase [Microcystaceae cyanobacterium]